MTRHVNLFHMLNVLRCRVEWGQKFKNDTRCACSSFVQRIILLQGKEEHVKCSVGERWVKFITTTQHVNSIHMLNVLLCRVEEGKCAQMTPHVI